jgi:hypothetical protein
LRSVAKVVARVLSVIVLPAMLASWFTAGGSIVLWVLHLFGVEKFLGFETGPFDPWLLGFAAIATGAGWLVSKLLEFAGEI